MFILMFFEYDFVALFETRKARKKRLIKLPLTFIEKSKQNKKCVEIVNERVSYTCWPRHRKIRYNPRSLPHPVAFPPQTALFLLMNCRVSFIKKARPFFCDHPILLKCRVLCLILLKYWLSFSIQQRGPGYNNAVNKMVTKFMTPGFN